jgi:hypothetical protein
MKKARQHLTGLLLAVAIPACTQAAGLDGSYAPANEPCYSSADCPSGICTGTPGWCSEICSTDGDCPAGSCLQNKAQLNICFPSCASDADCAVYGGTCQVGTTVDGVPTSVCAR